MATKMVKCGEQDNELTYEHYCDQLEDRAKIDPSYINLGTKCIVLKDEDYSNTLQVYIANSLKEWIHV